MLEKDTKEVLGGDIPADVPQRHVLPCKHRSTFAKDVYETQQYM